ncbi:MAG TPA: amidase [Usitatibacter sp.]|nr:amidase [Usitatibacter sp.]
MNQPLREIARRLRAGSLTAAALRREAAANLESSEARLGAYKTVTVEVAEAAAARADAAFARGQDRGVLQGIPVSVKDIYGVPGVPIFAGSPRELPARWQAPGPLVACLLAQDAVVMGKTHTVEFAFGALGLNDHWPTPRNPWDAAVARVPGGSSSGAGVSLCQGSALIALGSDTSGSVRIPAALTGNVGYKPTIGRWSTAGITPLSLIFDTPGVLARTVDDAMLAAAEMERHFGRTQAGIGGASLSSALRIGIPESFFWDDCDAGISEPVRGALAELERAGHRLVPLRFPEAALAFEIFKAGGTAGAELLAFLRHELPEWVETLDRNVSARMNAAAEVSAVEFLGRRMSLERWSREARAHFEHVDVIATPTTAQSPPAFTELSSWEDYRPRNLKMARNTSIANLLQLAAITLPVGLDALRLPVGLQVMASHGRDDFLFAAAGAFEAVLGTGSQRIGFPPGLAPR